MSDARIFPEGTGTSSERVDEFLDELATGQHNVDRPPLNPIDDATVSDWEAEVGATDGTSDSDAPSSPADQAKATASDLAGQATDKAKDAADTAMSKGQEAVSTAKDKAGELSGQAQAKTDEGISRVAGGIGQAAEALRQHGEGQSGTVGTAASTAADKLEGASSFLQDKGSDELLQDLEALIRRKPVESLLVAVGAGFVLSKLLG